MEGQRDVTVNFSLTGDKADETQLNDSADPIVKAGSGVDRPRLMHSVDPQYTKDALNAHVEGLVALSLVVGSDGKPRDFKVARR